ncbi:uncharacterized protein LOC143025547 isoform X2 [Oratosquilla oratoria]
MTGSHMIASMLSLSWMVTQAEVTSAVGPARPPVPATVGLWVGLDSINVTYHSNEMYLNEDIPLDCVKSLRGFKEIMAVRGLPWPLVSVIEYLGGQRFAWKDDLGRTLLIAGIYCKALLVAALYMWAVWCVLFLVAPGLTPVPLVLTGVLQCLATCTYAFVVRSMSNLFLIVAGEMMILKFGWCWYSTLASGLVLTLVGFAFFLMEFFHPGVFTTVFEIDFGGPTHRSYLYIPKVPSPDIERITSSPVFEWRSSGLEPEGDPFTISPVIPRTRYDNSLQFHYNVTATPISSRIPRRIPPSGSNSYKDRLRNVLGRESPLSSTKQFTGPRGKDRVVPAQRLSYVRFPRIDDLEINEMTSTEKTSVATPVSGASSPAIFPQASVLSAIPAMDLSISSSHEVAGSPSRSIGASSAWFSASASSVLGSPSAIPPTQFELVHEEGTRRIEDSGRNSERKFEEERYTLGDGSRSKFARSEDFISEFQLRKRTPPSMAYADGQTGTTMTHL